MTQGKKSVPLALVSVIIWSTVSTVAKIVLLQVPGLQTLALGSAFAFVFMLAVLFANGAYKKLKTYSVKQYLQMAGLGFLGLFLYSALYYYALGWLTAGEACILNYLWPMMLVLFSCLILKEKLTVKKAAALIMSFAGVVLLSFGNGAGAGNRALGIALCVAAAACYGLYCVLNKKTDFDQTVLMTVIWLTVTVCAFALGPITETWVKVQGLSWLGLIWIGVFVNAVAYLTWGLSLKYAKSTALIANLAYIVPVLSLILSAAVLKEPVTWQAVLALGLIVGGILLQSLK